MIDPVDFDRVANAHLYPRRTMPRDLPLLQAQQAALANASPLLERERFRRVAGLSIEAEPGPTAIGRLARRMCLWLVVATAIVTLVGAAAEWAHGVREEARAARAAAESCGN